jgi:hypothetical protein
MFSPPSNHTDHHAIIQVYDQKSMSMYKSMLYVYIRVYIHAYVTAYKNMQMIYIYIYSDRPAYKHSTCSGTTNFDTVTCRACKTECPPHQYTRGTCPGKLANYAYNEIHVSYI